MTILVAAIDPNLKWYFAFFALTTALVIGVPMAMRVIREARGEVEPETEDDLLTPLAQAFAEGQMSKDEYERIRASIDRGGVGLTFPPKAKPVSPPAPVVVDEPGPSGPDALPSTEA